MSDGSETERKQWAIMNVDPTMSASIGKLAEALAKAQLAMGNAAKDSTNPHFKSKYADLASVREAVIPHLAANGIAVIQRIESTNKEGVAVSTMLVHASGEFIQDQCWLPVTKADAQGFGSAITYARRYSLAAVAGIAAEDDDGNAAVGKPVTTTTPTTGAPVYGPKSANPKAANSDKPLKEMANMTHGAEGLRNTLEMLKADFNPTVWGEAKKDAQALKAKGVEFDDDFRAAYAAVKAVADKKVA